MTFPSEKDLKDLMETIRRQCKVRIEPNEHGAKVMTIEYASFVKSALHLRETNGPTSTYEDLVEQMAKFVLEVRTLPALQDKVAFLVEASEAMLRYINGATKYDEELKKRAEDLQAAMRFASI
jgi:hypothetical protein